MGLDAGTTAAVGDDDSVVEDSQCCVVRAFQVQDPPSYPPLCGAAAVAHADISLHICLWAAGENNA